MIAHAVFEAAVKVAGETLYWKSSLKRILRASGVSEAGYLRYEHLSKYQILRGVWAELDSHNRGLAVQKRILAELANLQAPEDRADQRAGREVLEELKRLCQAQGLLVDPAENERREQRKVAARAAEKRDHRASSLLQLKSEFSALHKQENRQARGYAFEKLLANLFRLYGLEFRGSYKTDTDQVDGALVFESFTYLLGARWREAAAVDADLSILKAKVARRIDATRGLFISMAGFRPEVAQLYRLSHDQRLIMVDGYDLTLILEGRVELNDALSAKISAASIEGEPFLQLSSLL